jgi:hypothetical protein
VTLEKDGEGQLNQSCKSEVLHSQGGKEYRSYNKKKEGELIGHILRRNCLLKLVIEGERGGRIGRQLQNDLKEMRGSRKLKDKAVDRTVWKTRFGRGYGLVIRQTTE